jgi:hypothetical protein
VNVTLFALNFATSAFWLAVIAFTSPATA